MQQLEQKLWPKLYNTHHDRKKENQGHITISCVATGSQCKRTTNARIELNCNTALKVECKALTKPDIEPQNSSVNGILNI